MVIYLGNLYLYFITIYKTILRMQSNIITYTVFKHQIQFRAGNNVHSVVRFYFNTFHNNSAVTI